MVQLIVPITNQPYQDHLAPFAYKVVQHSFVFKVLLDGTIEITAFIGIFGL